MSFVDDLNKRVDRDELIEEEEKQIRKDVQRIIDLIKQVCMQRRYDHKLEGYYGWDGWNSESCLANTCETAATFRGTYTSQVDKITQKSLDTDKFITYLEDSLSRLGFEKFQVKLIPTTRYEKVENGKSIFGSIKYREVARTDYKVYFKVEW